ncbi:UNVERIFIED_CONTAM: hypothetical protein PYX00_000745 [Menopon gallinae]|uniref:C2H2-type domain-containing protein n=1 Tax=Menopon gallinae TaxID=328185 RepID=A0AAW2IA80_9NEOP
MSRSILRKGKSDPSEMEKEQAQDEPFLKIGTIWSETEGSFEDIKIKEENISDLELENSPNEESTDQLLSELEKPQDEKKSPEKEIGQIKNNEEKLKQLNVTGTSANCLHEHKNFKICKKRLRCCDCRATLCPECHCTIYTSVQTHFSKSDNYNERLYACKLCSMIFKSNCALQAHIRIHLLDTPYVCPDCGAVYNNIYFLSLHLINKCYHVYKVISNGCKFCMSRNMSPGEFVTHFEQTHIRPVFKCSQCSTIFQTTADFNRHLGVSHKNQNVTCLSYYSCRVCGNLIISKHLYAKHIKFHQEHTAAFQIGYLCSCGQSFNTATTFRCHFKFCSKKGILPPQWTYLQVTLKTQEIMNIHGGAQKSSFAQKDSVSGVGPTDSVSESMKVQKKIDYNLFEDADSSDDLETSGSNSNDSDLMKSQNHEDDRKGPEHDSVEKNGTDLDKNEEKRISAVEEDTQAPEVEKENVHELAGNDKDHQENMTEISVGCNEIITDKIPNVQLVEECPVQSENIEKTIETTEKGDGSGDKNLKVLYDHIPCDHLGYLKTRKLSELQDITLRKSIMDGVSCEADTDKFLITSVLDEKTGLMRTKKVLIPKNQIVQTEDVTYLNGLENIQAVCNMQCRDVQKPRSTSFFSCPFCSVLFPKHLSTFQRFRLHIECYHPDASLDITVDRTQTPKSQLKYTSITPSDECESDDDVCDLDDVDLQTRLNQSLKKEKKETEPASKENSDSDKKRTAQKVEKREVDPKFRKKSSEATEKQQECLPVKNSVSTKIHDSRTVLRSALIQEVARMKDHEKLVSENSLDQERVKLRRDECEISIECPPVKKTKSLLRKQVSILNHKSRRVSEDSLSDERSLDAIIYPDESDQQGKNVSKSDSREGSEADGGDFEDNRDESRGRLTERRNSKRESDVWSEFYKTLKIAETFKKAKVKKQDAAEESSILNNYTNKRVVKKPKRYRESSNSEDSNDEEKGSVGESKNFENRLDLDEDDLYVKKKKLLDRLENVDYRILDYLLKLVDRKQKSVSLLKKNVEMKGFKKRVTNGVKLPKQKNEDEDNGENAGELSDVCEDVEWELTLPVDEKIPDRRRGRPRKTDPMLLKDRRASDVDKMFETYEGDFFTNRRKRKMSKLQSKKIQPEKNDFSSGQVITTKISESEKKLACAVCKECYQTETEFREHIQVHRMDENNHQCMECGECFVVRPSLEKHLHAFHKIKDVHKYIEENKCSTPDKPEEAELEPLKENQCKVCRDQFDNPHDLNKHFRIHGMAFLRQFKKSS